MAEPNFYNRANNENIVSVSGTAAHALFAPKLIVHGGDVIISRGHDVDMARRFMMDDELDIMQTQNLEPFETVLSGIFGGGEVKVSRLFRLSDMTQQENEQFEAGWASAEIRTRQVIARHLADIAEENFEVEFSPVFKHLLDDADETVKLAALDGLWDTTNVNVVRPIIDILNNVKNSVTLRQSAAATLAHFVLLGEWGQISPYVRDRVVDALLEQHENLENDEAVRCSALEAVGSSGNERVPGLILDAYDSGERRLQSSAVFAMGSSADDRWLHIVMAEMESPYRDMRMEAARAAGEIGSEEALAPLAELAFDEEEEVCMVAIEALGKIGGDRAKSILQNIATDDDLAHLADAANRAISQSDGPLSALDLDFYDDDDDDDDDSEYDYADDDYYGRLL